MSKTIITAYLQCDGSGCGRGRTEGYQQPVTSVERIEEEAAEWLDQHDLACRIIVSVQTIEQFTPFVLVRRPQVVKG
jgi:hypothetical protein